MHPPRRFLDLDATAAARARARYIILPAPYERTTSYGKGVRRGPAAILAASSQVELYDDELGRETWEAGIHTAPAVRFGRYQPGHELRRLAASAGPHVRAGKTVITLGGEHTVTLGAIEPYLDRYPDLTLLHIDAHADLRDRYQGTPYSHACVARRLLDRCRIVQVGVRSLSTEEAEIIAARALPVFLARDCRGPRWVASVVAATRDPVYVSIDVDALDPSIMPSTGTPEPGGLGWYELLSLLREVSARRRVVGADLTELAPRPGNHSPEFLCAKLVYRLIGYLETGSRPGRRRRA